MRHEVVSCLLASGAEDRLLCRWTDPSAGKPDAPGRPRRELKETSEVRAGSGLEVRSLGTVRAEWCYKKPHSFTSAKDGNRWQRRGNEFRSPEETRRLMVPAAEGAGRSRAACVSSEVRAACPVSRCPCPRRSARACWRLWQGASQGGGGRSQAAPGSGVTEG